MPIVLQKVCLPLLVTVTPEGSGVYVGGIIITDVLGSVVIGGAGAGAVEVALVVRSSINV